MQRHYIKGELREAIRIYKHTAKRAPDTKCLLKMVSAIRDRERDSYAAVSEVM